MVTDPESVRQAYNAWSEVYDTNLNRTRDLNAEVLRRSAEPFRGKRILEVGCGSGINTEWLSEYAREVVGVDFSEGMIERARQRVQNANVRFELADVTRPWRWEGGFGAVVVNLVLEHIADLRHVFSEAERVLDVGGRMYVAELHPYRQLTGTQARFDDPVTGERVLVPVVRHTISEFVNTGLAAGFRILELGEHAAPGEDAPRLFTMWLQRNTNAEYRMRTAG